MVLYVVATPIGNIKDITYRAVEILKESDIILCEDTRCSLKMLNYYGIRKKLISYHKFNEYKLIDKIIEDIFSPSKYLNDREKQDFNNLMKGFFAQPYMAKLITFNYIHALKTFYIGKFIGRVIVRLDRFKALRQK